MAKRAVFGVSITLLMLGVFGLTVSWVSESDPPGWTPIAGLLGGVAFVAAVMLTLRDVMRGLWKLERQQRSQIASVAAIDTAVADMQSAQKTHRDENATGLIVLMGRVGALERGQVEDVGGALGRIEREQGHSYRQIESVVGLLAGLGLRAPLPPMRRTWAMDPDAAALLVRTVFERQPGTVLELGSGISTALVARALAMIGSGRLRTLEHLPEFAREATRLLDSQGLGATVELVEAGLMDVEIEGSVWQWYDPRKFDDLGVVDFVIVDGPPNRTGDLARYPALPMLADRLSDGALIFLDDAAREDERRVLARWLDEFPVAVLDVPKIEKGVALLEWRSRS